MVVHIPANALLLCSIRVVWAASTRFLPALLCIAVEKLFHACVFLFAVDVYSRVGITPPLVTATPTLDGFCVRNRAILQVSFTKPIATFAFWAMGFHPVFFVGHLFLRSRCSLASVKRSVKPFDPLWPSVWLWQLGQRKRMFLGRSSNQLRFL